MKFSGEGDQFQAAPSGAMNVTRPKKMYGSTINVTKVARAGEQELGLEAAEANAGQRQAEHLDAQREGVQSCEERRHRGRQRHLKDFRHARDDLVQRNELLDLGSEAQVVEGLEQACRRCPAGCPSSCSCGSGCSYQGGAGECEGAEGREGTSEGHDCVDAGGAVARCSCASGGAGEGGRAVVPLQR